MNSSEPKPKLRLDQCGEVLSVTELERVLGVSRNNTYEIAREIGFRLGKRILVPRRNVEVFLYSLGDYESDS
jgi:hypothetical protein